LNLDAVNDGEVKDRDMGGRIIGCLRTKYANKDAALDSKCISELADVIQTSKLDVQLDVKLYQNCKEILDTKCPGVEKEDCLKLLYQKKELDHQGCKEQVIRIIKEGQADIHVDQVLAIACQTDVLRYCNDIPIGRKIFYLEILFNIYRYLGGGKQLQCLVRLRESVTKTCRNILSKRQELWSSVSDFLI
jgi:Golgi apparatus protein 1